MCHLIFPPGRFNFWQNIHSVSHHNCRSCVLSTFCVTCLLFSHFVSPSMLSLTDDWFMFNFLVVSVASYLYPFVSLWNCFQSPYLWVCVICNTDCLISTSGFHNVCQNHELTLFILLFHMLHSMCTVLCPSVFGDCSLSLGSVIVFGSQEGSLEARSFGILEWMKS